MNVQDKKEKTKLTLEKLQIASFKQLSSIWGGNFGLIEDDTIGGTDRLTIGLEPPQPTRPESPQPLNPTLVPKKN